MKHKFTSYTVVGKCAHCGINCWEETKGIPAIWPCGLEGCPYPPQNVVQFPKSATGTSLSQIIYEG